MGEGGLLSHSIMTTPTILVMGRGEGGGRKGGRKGEERKGGKEGILTFDKNTTPRTTILDTVIP